jgi:hypothetical protein
MKHRDSELFGRLFPNPYSNNEMGRAGQLAGKCMCYRTAFVQEMHHETMVFGGLDGHGFEWLRVQRISAPG